jgi:hypothetical protein
MVKKWQSLTKQQQGGTVAFIGFVILAAGTFGLDSTPWGAIGPLAIGVVGLVVLCAGVFMMMPTT